MARKSRRQDKIQNESIEKQAEWRTAVYARLSIEDSGIKNSDSIEMQINLVKHYVEQRPYLTLKDIYIDNGSSGTSFERPSFNRLMDDIRRGSINCVVVKDLSRFGRNYIETCEYIDKIFPFMQVRFISVNDNFDSMNCTNYSEGLIISLKNLINDAYVKDIS